MPDRSGQDQILVRNRSASGGVNTFSSPLDIEPTEVVDLTNGVASVPGIRSIRPGSSVIASGITHGPILAMSEFTPGDFNTELLAVSPGASYPLAGHLKVWKWPGSGNWSLVGTLTGFTSPTLPVDIVPGLDVGVSASVNGAPGGPAVVRFATQQPVLNQYYYGGGGISTCTGTNSMPTTGMFPMGLAVGRMFGAGRHGNSRGKAYFSDVASFCVSGWSSSQAFSMGGSTKQEIVAIKSFRGGDVMFFMQDRIEVLHLDGDPINGLSGSSISAGLWSRETIDSTIGCGSRRTVQTVGEDLIFIDQNANVRSIARTITDNSQGTKSQPLSAPIQSWIDRVNIAALGTAEAASYDRYYVISLPIDSATTPSHTFVADIINRAWYGPWTGVWSTVKSLAVATLNAATLDADKSPTLYVGGAETANGVVYRSFSGTTDSGNPIVYQETTKRESFGTLDARKKPSRLRVYALPSAGSTMMIEARKDGVDFKFVDYMDMSGSAPQLPTTGPIDFTGSGVVEKVMSLERSFENATDLQYRFTVTALQQVQILGYTTQVHMQNVNWTPN